MATPRTPQEFRSSFKSWPAKSLGTRKSSLGSGSSWGISQIEIFQVIRKPPSKLIPLVLQPFFDDAAACVARSHDLQSAITLCQQNWRAYTQRELIERAGKFAPYFTILAQVLETPLISDPRPELRMQPPANLPVFADGHAVAAHANDVDAVTGAGAGADADVDIDADAEASIPSSPPRLPTLPPQWSSSPSAPPIKRRRQEPSSSPAYFPSEQSDQSSHDKRAKTEMTTNACVYELLRCVTELLREAKEESHVYLEWSITHDTFGVAAGDLEYSTTNDGNLVHKGYRDGLWQRASTYSYCSIEAKSWHNVDGKPVAVQAQEAAHLISMFSQLTTSKSNPTSETILPLVYTAQNIFSIVFGRFPPEYAQYLHDGSQPHDGVFVEVEECGMFKLQDSTDLQTVFTIIVALHRWLQSLGAKS